MDAILENCLFKKNPDRFEKLREEVKQFNTLCNGHDVIVFVNTKGKDAAESDIAELLQFFEHSDECEYSDPLCIKMLTGLKAARRNKDWRRERMTLQTKFDDLCEESREKGRAEGLAEGLEEGRAEGRVLEVIESIREGDYSEKRGAQKLGISLEKLRELMERGEEPTGSMRSPHK